jgi:adenine/guanine phosphoribosyltransferase-like PRPP-binding protein
MKSLKSYLHQIVEGFYIADNSVYFDPSEKGFINTKFGKTASMKPYEGKLRFGRYYAAYQKEKEVDQAEYVEVLKAIKGQSSKYQMGHSSYEKFLNRTAAYLAKLIHQHKIDTILLMDSSSSLVNELVHEINRRLPKYFAIRSFSKAIFKNPNIDEIFIDTQGIELGEQQMKAIKKALDESKSSGYFSIKNVKLVQQRKFFKDWLKINDNFLKNIVDKNVCIIDDFVTSAETLQSASELLEKAGASSVTGFVIMKA